MLQVYENIQNWQKDCINDVYDQIISWFGMGKDYEIEKILESRIKDGKKCII